MKMHTKILLCTALVSQTLFFPSCGFHSEKETKKVAPVAKSVSYDYFTTVDVAKGDVVASTSFTLSYKNSSINALGFAVDKARIDNVFVSVGDYVHTGDLLMQCNSGKLKNEISELEVKIQKLESETKFYGEMAEVESDRKYTYAAYKMDYESELPEEYASLYQEKTNELNVSRYKLEELQKKLEGCSIYATMDGFIGYIAQTNSRDYLKSNATAITITDGIPYFLCATSNIAYFEVGQKYQLGYYFNTNTSSGRRRKNNEEASDENAKGTLNNPYYIEVECTAIDVLNENTGTYSCRFVPTSPIDIPSDKSVYAKIVIKTDEAKGVLYVPSRALIRSGDSVIVYVQNENGERTIRKVEIGVEASDITEIKSGLELGDIVITNGSQQ